MKCGNLGICNMQPEDGMCHGAFMQCAYRDAVYMACPQYNAQVHSSLSWTACRWLQGSKPQPPTHVIGTQHACQGRKLLMS